MDGKIITICFPVEHLDIKKLHTDRQNILEAQGVLLKAGCGDLARSLDTSVAVVEKLIEHYSISTFDNHWTSGGSENYEEG